MNRSSDAAVGNSAFASLGSVMAWSMAGLAAVVAAGLVQALAGATSCSAGAMLALGVLGVGSMTDLVTGRIPNWLTYGACAVGLLLCVFAAIGGEFDAGVAEFIGGPGLLYGSIAALSMLAFGIAMMALGALGGGDVKLLAALGFLVGLRVTVNLFVVGLAALAVVYMLDRASRGRLLLALQSLATAIATRLGALSADAPFDFGTRKLPLAPGLLVGFVLAPLAVHWPVFREVIS